MDLSHNKIRYLRSISFEQLSLLQYIDLRYNEISSSKFFRFYQRPIILQSPGCFLLGHNSLKYIFTDNFRKQIQVKFIDFSFNEITSLSRYSFRGLNFSQISLSGNKLRKIDLNHFYINQELQELDVSNNFIVNITNEESIQLSTLKTANLSHNNLTNIFPTIISQLPTLKKIDLSYNRLSDFESLTSLLNQSLRIYAEGNPWECSCNSSVLYRQLSGKHTFACRDGGDKCLVCATPANLTGILIQNTCSEPKSTEPTNTQPSQTQFTNTEHSNLITILSIISGILATTLFGAGIGWKINQRKLKNCSSVKSSQKHSNQEIELGNNKAVNFYNSTAQYSFKAPPPKHSQILSPIQALSPAPRQDGFHQVHAKMKAENNQTAHQNMEYSKEINDVYMNQINLQQKNKLSAHDGKQDYVNINVTAHQTQIQRGNEEYDKSKSNRVHNPFYEAENYYNVTPGSNPSYCDKEESLYVQPMN